MENIRIPIHDLLVSAIPVLDVRAIRMIDANKWMDKFGGWAICLVCAFAGLVVQKIFLSDGQIPNLFSFMGAMAQFPYFVAGVGIRRFSKQIITHKTSVALSSLAIVGVLSLQLEWFYPAVSKDLLYGLTASMGHGTLALLLSQSYSSRLFTWVEATLILFTYITVSVLPEAGLY